MHKQSQSLLDFLLQSPGVYRRDNHIGSKEVKALVHIWNGNRDAYGNLIVPADVDAVTVASLVSKGLIKSRYGITSQPVVEITSIGKDIVKNSILKEESVFSKHSDRFELDSVKPNKTASKTAGDLGQYVCQDCLENRRVPFGQEPRGAIQLHGRWLCRDCYDRFLGKREREDPFYNWLDRAQNG